MSSEQVERLARGASVDEALAVQVGQITDPGSLPDGFAVNKRHSTVAGDEHVGGAVVAMNHIGVRNDRPSDQTDNLITPSDEIRAGGRAIRDRGFPLAVSAEDGHDLGRIIECIGAGEAGLQVVRRENGCDGRGVQPGDRSTEQIGLVHRLVSSCHRQVTPRHPQFLSRTP